MIFVADRKLTLFCQKTWELKLNSLKESRDYEKYLVYYYNYPCLAQPSLAQEDKKLLRKGNKEFKKEAFNEAEINYRKAIETNPMNDNAVFNLGTSRYKQDNFEEAANDFNRAAEMSKSDRETAEATII